MVFRLLLDLVKPAQRRRLFALLERIQEAPHRFSDLIDRDEVGRRLDVCAFEGVAIYYWVDTADRHIKIRNYSGLWCAGEDFAGVKGFGGPR